MKRRAWKVTLQDGAFTMVRLAGEDVTLSKCLKILGWRGYEDKDIKNIEEVWEEG